MTENGTTGVKTWAKGLVAGIFVAVTLVGLWLISALPYKIIPGNIAQWQFGFGLTMALGGLVITGIVILMARMDIVRLGLSE